MHYCRNCGTIVDNDSRFCPECGAPQVIFPEEKASANDSARQKAASPSAVFADGLECGYLLTNTELLAQALCCTHGDILQRIERYIRLRQQGGVQLLLLDTCDYAPCQKVNRSLLRRNKRLTPADGWLAHQRLLVDRYLYDTGPEGGNRDVRYLFIIGGDDVIPVPRVGKHKRDDSPIASDVPYAFLLDEKVEQLIDSMELFYQSAHLLVGRLPFGSDATLETFDVYIRNVVRHSERGMQIDFNGMYIQCDTSWKRVTSLIADDFFKERLVVGNLPTMHESTSFQGIRLTPPLGVSTPMAGLQTQDAFWYPASLLLFNMHGGEHPGSPGYSGEVDHLGHFCTGITPQFLSLLSNPNVIMSEACWGAKFIGLHTMESMMLSALTTNTLAFIGSSHVAYGCVDGERISMRDADIIAAACLSYAAWGAPFGELLWYARNINFHVWRLDAQTMTTALEFNLYGDPSLRAPLTHEGTLVLPLPEEKAVGFSKRASLQAHDSNVPKLIGRSELFNRNTSSILMRTRMAVDRNLKEIRSRMDKSLYSQYGVDPRQLDSIFKQSYADGKEVYTMTYDRGGTQFCVTTDKSGNIESITSSK